MVQEELTVSADIGGDDMAVLESNPTEETVAQVSEEAETPTSVPSAEETPAQEGEGDVYTPVFKGKTYPIRADDRQEITTLLQLGMKHREFLPTYERLARLTADIGGRSVTAFINNLCDRQEELLRERAIETYGEEAGTRFYEMERDVRLKRYESTQQELGDELQTASMSQEERLASEFSELQADYPEFTDFRDVPASVVETALVSNISLLDAHNRFVLAEQKRQHQQAALAKSAAAQTTGSLSQSGDDAPTAMDAFLTGLHRRT